MSTWSSFLHHPAFQSLLLPCVLSLLAMAVLRAGCGVRWAPLGAALGLLGALAWLPGFEWPAASRVQKLPWTVLAGLALAAVAMALQRGGPAAPRAAAPVQPAAAAGAAALTVSALGLAALAAGGGSLLLAQLALMLATCTAVLGAWLWLRPAPGLQGAAAAPSLVPLVPLLLAWLALAWSWALSSAIAPGAASTTSLTAAAAADAGRLALLALAFAAPPLLLRQRWARARPRWTPLLAALLAALPVAVAVVWQFSAPAAQVPGTPDDDPYYTPA
ncbi:hypothetical protein ACPOLB_24715 [Rubrivivax sp. RP6-9]|uniref:hypothetical protein n=1 Tax=Rubrivivax sp. RP6-9 TaxID=3415750 RepID=UPI003CC57B1F